MGDETKKTPWVQTTVLLDERIQAALKLAAFKEDRSKSSIVRDALEEYLTEYLDQPHP